MLQILQETMKAPELSSFSVLIYKKKKSIMSDVNVPLSLSTLYILAFCLASFFFFADLNWAHLHVICREIA